MAGESTNLEDFNSGTFRKQYEYESFSPNPINHTWTWDDANVNTMLETATRKLGEINEKLITFGRRAENANKLIQYLFQQPFVNVNEVSEYLNVTTPTANRLINDFEELGLLKETTGYERNRIFFFARYYQIFLE